MTEPTIAELRLLAAQDASTKLSFQLLLWKSNRPSYAEWADVVEQAIALQILKLASRRNFLKDASEDMLSTAVDMGLSGLGLRSSATVVNGNVDVVVEHDIYRWLAEAKIASDLGKVYHGYQQLTTRYATGMSGQTSGGMLLYCKHDDAAVTMAGWRAALEHQDSSSDPQPEPDGINFRSKATCQATAAPLNIVHLAVPLFHDPQEDKKKLTEGSKKAADAARKAQRAVAKKAQTKD